MRVNKKILLAGTLLISAVLLFCLGFSYYCRLKEPVFLYHYIETPVYDTDEGYANLDLTLYYITNVYDTREVNYVTFDEAPELMFYVNNNRGGSFINWNSNADSNTGNAYGRYRLKEVSVYFEPSGNDYNMDELHLSKANITFNNGDVLQTDIGEIILYKQTEDDQDIHNVSSTGSNDGTEVYEYEVNNMVTLKSMDSPLLNKLPDNVAIRVNDKNLDEINGIKLQKGSNLKISSKFTTPYESVPFLTVYDVKPKLTYETEDGKSHYTRYYGINYSPDRNSLTFSNLFRYVAARGLL